MEILYILLVLLLVTRGFGELAERFGQPALLGELVSGILLGVLARQYAGVLPVLAELPHDATFQAITELGIFFLMLLAGVELRPRDIARASGSALGVALGGLLLPLLLGVGLGLAWIPDSPWRTAQALFVGVALAITAVPISVGVLMDLGRLRSPVGRTIVSAALFDDILSLVLLALLTAVIRTGTLPDAASLAALGGRVLLFFVIAVAVGRFVFPWLARRVARLSGSEFEFTFLLVSGLAYAVLAERLGMHFLIGAFLAGLFFGRDTIDERTFEDVQAKVRAVTSGFLGPVFFASIGMQLDAGALGRAPFFVLALVAVATLGKLVGAGLPARAAGLRSREALGVGIGMNARGAVELIVADVALRAGLFDHPEPVPDLVKSLYSAVVVMAVATTLATPPALSRCLRDVPADGDAGEGEDAGEASDADTS